MKLTTELLDEALKRYTKEKCAIVSCRSKAIKFFYAIYQCDITAIEGYCHKCLKTRFIESKKLQFKIYKLTTKELFYVRLNENLNMWR